MPDAGERPHDRCATPAATGSWSKYRVLIRRLGPAGILTVLAGAIPAVFFVLIAGLAVHWAPWLREHLAAGVVIYVLSFWVLGGIAVVPTWIHSGLGGLAFGFAVGYPAALVSYLGGSLVGYFIAVRFSGRRVTDLIAEHPKWQAVYNALLRSGFWRTLIIMTLIRSTPSSPFAITNVVSAAMRVPVLPFILATILGLAPRTAAVVYTTYRFHKLDAASPYDTAMFVGSVGASFLAILVIVVIAKRALAHMTNNTNP
jgi:uncharacterized membrane protein YdjX (TVP38/TMEM64 family)